MWTNKKGSLPILMLLFLLFLFITNGYFVGSASASYGPPNNFRWVDEKLCGSGQPDRDEFRWLRDNGVRAIICLTIEGDDASYLASLRLMYLHIPIKDDGAPTTKQVLTFLDYIDDHNPALVHCSAGGGRAGTMIACYRIARYGWSAQKAIDEAVAHGMKPWEAQRQIQFIKDFENYWKQRQSSGMFTETWLTVSLVLVVASVAIGIAITSLRRKSRRVSHRV